MRSKCRHESGQVSTIGGECSPTHEVAPEFHDLGSKLRDRGRENPALWAGDEAGVHRRGIRNRQPVVVDPGAAAIDPREQTVVRPRPGVRADDKGVATEDADGAGGRVPDGQDVAARSLRRRTLRLNGNSTRNCGEWVLGGVGVERVAGWDSPHWRESSAGRGEFDEVEGIEGDKEVTPVTGGREIDARAEHLHAARPSVEYGDAVPAVLGRDTAAPSLEEVHAGADADEARGGGIGRGNDPIAALARRPNVESPRGEPHQLSGAWRDQVARTDGRWRCSRDW